MVDLFNIFSKEDHNITVQTDSQENSLFDYNYFNDMMNSLSRRSTGDGTNKIPKTNFVKIKNNTIYFDFGVYEHRKFLKRVKNTLDKHLTNLFQCEYDPFQLMMWKRKRIASLTKVKIRKLYTSEFFAMELRNIFITLNSKYRSKIYKAIIEELEAKTYLYNLFVNPKSKYKIALNTKVTEEFINNPLKDYQQEFIEYYDYFKRSLNLRGYILGFDQGLGKTMTAIGLALHTDKTQVIVICPNTLRSVWRNELCDKINSYKLDINKAIEDIYCLNSEIKEFTTSKRPKWIIANNESIDKIKHLLRKNEKTLIVIDESQNFRYITGSRWVSLINMIDSLYINNEDNLDVLCMSGTPIKAKPSEMAPALMCIDPLFNQEASQIFVKAFSLSTISAGPIIEERFGKIIYRKLKTDVLELPNKTVDTIKLKVDDEEDYYLRTVFMEVQERFWEIYQEKAATVEKYRPLYEKYINKYCSPNCPAGLKDKFLSYLRITIVKNKTVNLHEFEYGEFLTFEEKYVIPNITDNQELKTFRALQSMYNKIKGSAHGLAVGEIIPKRRAEMFIDIINQNEERIIELINNSEKKVCLFTMCKKVIPVLEALMTKNNLKYVTITGDNAKQRPTLIKSFIEDDDIDVLIATNSTLQTGVTLTVANTELIFGPPWREADFKQLTDRIYRIGQDTDCFIYNIELDSGEEKNLSTRMNMIMQWSGDMINAYIEDSVNKA